MVFLLSFFDFFIDNINVIMIFLGFIIIASLFLILYIEKKRTDKFDKRNNNDISNENKINTKTSINEVENIILQENDIKNKKEEVNLLNQTLDNEKGNITNNISDSNDIIKFQSTSQESIETKDIKQSDEKDEEVLVNYEHVIQESDKMLQAMQDIIDDNIKQMQSLEQDNIEDDDEINDREKVNIVSKYKVLYDKVKKEWVVKKEGTTRAVKRFKDREDAILFAKKCTIDSDLGTTFHQKDGKFQKKAKKI